MSRRRVRRLGGVGVHGWRVPVEGGLHEHDDLGPRRDGAVVRRDAQPKLVPDLEVVSQGLVERDRAAQLSPATGGGGDVGVVPPDAEVTLAVPQVAGGPRPALDAGPTLVQRDGHVVAGVDVSDFDCGNAGADLWEYF